MRSCCGGYYSQPRGESSLVPTFLCPVGTGSLPRRTDTLFTLASKEDGVSIYLSIYLWPTKRDMIGGSLRWHLVGPSGPWIGNPSSSPTRDKFELNREVVARCCKLWSIGTMAMRDVCIESDNDIECKLSMSLRGSTSSSTPIRYITQNWCTVTRKSTLCI